VITHSFSYRQINAFKESINFISKIKVIKKCDDVFLQTNARSRSSGENSGSATLGGWGTAMRGHASTNAQEATYSTRFK
jgi:hypothetical protein